MLENYKQTEVIELLYECEILVSTAVSVLCKSVLPRGSAAPDGGVFSSLIWYKLDVNVSDQKFFFLLCIVFLPIHRLQTFIVFS